MDVQSSTRRILSVRRLPHNSRMPRRLVAVLLYLLLLCMQQEGIRHELDHLRAQLRDAHEQSWQLAVDSPCDECALLAAAAHAVAPSAAAISLAPSAGWRHAGGQGSFAPATAVHYSARAPPIRS